MRAEIHVRDYSDIEWGAEVEMEKRLGIILKTELTAVAMNKMWDVRFFFKRAKNDSQVFDQSNVVNNYAIF